MSGHRIASLCSGYEGLGMAVQAVIGGELVFVADNDPGAAKILAHHYPDVPNLGDITAIDWAAAGPVDVLTAGFPCFPAGTLIDAGEDGLRAIETLRVGDLVLTHNRRRRAVTSVMRRDAEDVLLVKAMGAPAFRATAEHPFYVRRLTAGRVRSWSAPEWIEAGQLDKNCFLAMPLDDPGTDPILGVPLAYVVGRWLGDGWIIDHPRRGRANSWMRKAIICCAADEDAELAAAIKAAGLHATRSPERTVTKFHITSADLVKMLKPFGRGAAGKQIPGWVFTAPLAEQEAMLRGWLDADGSQQASGQWRATTISERLAHGMARIARTVHGVATSVHRFDVATRTTIEGRDVGQKPQFQVAIPPRNRESFIADGYAWVPIRSISAAEPCEVFNVSVDEDESYVAYGYVVHNCQDVSCAGARKGLRAGNRTGVWAYVAQAIGVLRPSIVLLENVRGLLSAGADSNMEPCPWCMGESGDEHALRACGAVLGDLADLGFDAEWATVSAADAGAPHRRERVFIVAWPAAHADDLVLPARSRSVAGWPAGRERRDTRPDRRLGDPGEGSATQDADCAASGERWLAAPGQAPGGWAWADAGRSGGAPAPADTRSAGLEVRAVESDRDERPASERDRGDAPADANGERLRSHGRTAHGDAEVDRPHNTEPDRGRSPVAADTAGDGRDARQPESAGLIGGSDAPLGGHDALADPDSAAGGRHEPRSGPGTLQGLAVPERAPQQPGRRDSCSGDASAVDWVRFGPAIRRWEAVTGRPAPRPTEPGRTGERLSPRFVEWLMGLPEGWVTDVPGLSRNAQLHALGNGVVPQQCALALRLLLGIPGESRRAA